MYLKSIEVQGFKSFANKINFEFHNGITGIVGPNGSGKSNVADAVRWVLGEQRIKQLRGASMQDVIFSGTELRKPLSYAYVAITLDNSDHQLAIDYDEVTVARRLYRSGESEYLINGSPCRLKDINEMFYDTGIGKEGYSIIGQGQIDAILSGKPEERRELFDEAAGIVKFKRRKLTAEKKLESEEANLVRVSDILKELERQVGPLEKQAEKAKVYLQKKEILKNLDVNMFLLENNDLNEQLKCVNDQIDTANSEYKETDAKYKSIKDDYESTALRLEQLEKDIEEERKSLSETSVIRSRLESQINILKEQINSINGNNEHLFVRRDNVTSQCNEKKAEEVNTLEAKKSADEMLSNALAEKNEIENRLNEVQSRIEALNTEIEDSKNNIINALNERGNIKSRLERLTTVKEQIDIRKAELTSKLVSARTDEARQQDIIRKYQEEFDSITEEIKVLNKEIDELTGKVDAFKGELSSLDEKLKDKQLEYHRDMARLESLSNITERYEGYGNSVKLVMEQKTNESGIVGVVADIIKADRKYEIAIETALGGNIQNIVTKEEETAKKMIALLKRNKAGRATFLPLTSIKNPQEFKTREVLDEKGVIGMADELVKTDKEYADVAKAMLGRIVVVDNVDNAVKIARKYNYGIRMVTLEGELLVPGGAISGGAFKNNSNLLGRRREMDELEKLIATTKDEIDEINFTIDRIKNERNECRADIEKKKLDLQNKFITQNTCRLSLTAAKNRQEESLADVDSLRAESGDIEKKIKENDEERQRIEDELKASFDLEKDNEKIINELQVTLEENHKEESLVLDMLKAKEVDTEKYKQQADFEQTNLNRVLADRTRIEDELQEIIELIETGEQQIVEKKANIEEISKTIATSYTTESDTEKKLKQDIRDRETLSEKQKQFFNLREEIADHMSRIDKELTRLQVIKDKCEENLQGRIDYMWNEYEITLVDAETMKNPEMNDLGSMRSQVKVVREEIKKLGDVNVNAIEDYKEVSERYNFLKTQHEDLIEAKKTLEGIISELDIAMRKQFKEKFKAIETEFDKVFKELFGGGTGTLELMEDQDILEAGIKIIAQPPGKKLQNMMQLSGGEKALTAIALLFAIQNLKPSPFCLLDEIEAALDESNVGRFAKYLHKLTKHTQFIVITHRRGTMESADRLYGITMQEKGVSALVSVNLVDDALK
ncbi:MAG: chromosome segregation protein SMC [Lachnospiraceae bacterium]|nr:chromosome segregation protein SMC [Lachnospiraceae bacterium]